MAKSYTTGRYEWEAARQRAIAAKSSGSARTAALSKAEAAEKAAEMSARIDADIGARERRGSFRLLPPSPRRRG